MNSKTKSCAGLLKHKVKKTKNYKKSNLKQVKCKSNKTNLNKAKLKTINNLFMYKENSKIIKKNMS